MEVSGHLHAPAALPPGKRSRYPLYRRLGGPQGQYRRCGEEKDFCPSRESNPGRPVHSPLFYRLNYPGPTIGEQVLNKVGENDSHI
jgi:hypothetical protein